VSKQIGSVFICSWISSPSLSSVFQKELGALVEGMAKTSVLILCLLSIVITLITTNGVGATTTVPGQAGLNMCSIRPPTEGEIAISHPSIRLPISNTSEIQFKLSAINGCFKWFVLITLSSTLL